uniref:Double-stranded RNA-binding protein 8 n=1 Tax=Anthurium amnicola TaxID=1678845 RepID=A0A1D1YWG1_9ARAE
MADGNPQKGVTDCYVFKSRLQEYAQKVGIPTPVYETVKEGPSHEPVFKSTVIVNNVRYDSLPGFFNRKSAEQSAAEVALVELGKSGKMTASMPTVSETGLCKNLLQEYAQKMNYAIPCYQCNRQPSAKLPFSCTVEIGGIQYIGAAAKTKKEAEIKAARTALLAIQCTCNNETNGVSQFTVLPGKKKGKESDAETGTVKNVKPKKPEFKKKWSKRKFTRNKGNRSKINKHEQVTAGGDGSLIEFVNGGMLTINGSECGQPGGSTPYSNGQKMDNVGSDIMSNVGCPGNLTFEADLNFHHVQVPLIVMDASTIPQDNQFGNPAMFE